MTRRIIAVITSATRRRVIVTAQALSHAMKHFSLPEDIFLELLERVLKDPTLIRNKHKKMKRISL